MSAENLGRIHWSMKRTVGGHREYKAIFRVETDDVDDGPANAFLATGLPTLGTAWTLGNDSDSFAICTGECDITPQLGDGNPGKFWLLTYKFTTKPFDLCSTTNYSNPTNAPDEISGTFSTRAVDVFKDKDGDTIRTTSYEPVTVESDEVYPTVTIKQTLSDVQLSTVATMCNTLNNATLWGLATRKIKLANVNWRKRLYGNCTAYYERTLNFEINDNTWDREDIPNKGSKVIRGDWNTAGTVYTVDGSADVDDQKDYIQAQDSRGNPIEAYLNKTTGSFADDEVYLDKVELLPESNFLTLNIPTSL